MPDRLRAFVDAIPVTLLADTLRSLMNGVPASRGSMILLGVSALMTAVSAPVSLRAY